MLSKLANFLDHATPRILAEWMELVRRDPHLESAERLRPAELVDHVPALLEDLCALLRSGGSEPEGAPRWESDASEHGMERWRQGYRFDELLWEITQLRTVLIKHTTDFKREQGAAFNVEEQARAFTKLHGFLDRLAWRSAQRYVDEQQRELKKLSASRLHLTRTVSHELRNVLNGLGLAAQSLEDGGESDVAFLRDMLGRNIGQMRDLLDDLLELSSLVSGQMAVRVSQFSATTLLHEIVTTYTPVAEAKGLKLVSELAPDLPDMATDYLRCKQVAANLVSNAIKYTEAGEVRIQIGPAGADHWSIRVSDTGVGIAADEQERIFSELYRVKETAHTQGVGLGLSIVERILELLYGRIEVQSALGQGSTFEVILPRIYVSPN